MSWCCSERGRNKNIEVATHVIIFYYPVCIPTVATCGFCLLCICPALSLLVVLCRYSSFRFLFFFLPSLVFSCLFSFLFCSFDPDRPPLPSPIPSFTSPLPLPSSTDPPSPFRYLDPTHLILRLSLTRPSHPIPFPLRLIPFTPPLLDPIVSKTPVDLH